MTVCILENLNNPVCGVTLPRQQPTQKVGNGLCLEDKRSMEEAICVLHPDSGFHVSGLHLVPSQILVKLPLFIAQISTKTFFITL